MAADAGTRSDAPTTLVEAKLMLPRVRPKIVPRPRLQRRLDECSSTELTLISAPVGSGKTVALGAWTAAHRDEAIAWVSLDRADDDPVRLWTYAATAVDRVRSGLGRNALQRLRTPGVPVETSVDELLNGMASYGQPIVMALDDVHVLHGEASLSSIEHAIAHLPPNARMIAASRVDPPLALARMRGRGQLAELRAAELAFSVDEARTLLVEHEGLALDDDDLELLVQRSEGWPAGIYLAALWLRGLADPHAGIREFAGANRHVADFLTSEVLERLDAATHEFLTRSSVLGRFTAEMCDAVLELHSSGAMLGELARSNLFLVPLDARGEWYRYHHLFADLLRMELDRVDPAAADELHRRTAAWCHANGLTEDAIEHASATGDPELLADVLVDHHLTFLRTARTSTILRHIEALPTRVIVERPVLSVVGALASGLQSGPAAERARLLGLADRSAAEVGPWSPYVEAGVSLARSVWIDGDVATALGHARRAAELGRAGQTESACASLASLAYALYLSGDVAGAGAGATEAIERPEAQQRPHGLVYALATRALVDAEQGRAHVAEATARQALEFASAAGLGSASTTGHAHVALGTALAALGRLREAEREAVRGEALRRAPDERVEHVHALLVLARIRVANGLLTAAGADLARAREALSSFADPGWLPALADEIDTALGRAYAGLDGTGAGDELSAAELRVLRLLATPLSQREVGQQLFLSLNTVKTHTRGIYRKLGVASRDDAVLRARMLGLLELPESPG